jgi:DnaJ-class molecular chaperone
MADNYKILGVAKTASEQEIRRVYRSLARKYHPDLNPGDKKSEARFKEINEAYEVLSDKDSRRKYDVYGDQWKHASQIEQQRARGGGSPSDLGFNWARTTRQRPASRHDRYTGLDDLLSGLGGSFRGFSGSRGSRIRSEAPVTVSLEDAFGGTRVTATLSVRGRERRYEVTIPPGVDNGSVVRISPDKETELLFTVTVSPHPRFTRRGDDLYVEASIPFEDVILGGEAEVQTLDGRRIRVTVPALSQNGQNIRLRGQGMPRLRSSGSKGDLYVTVRPSLPTETTQEEIDLVHKLKGLRADADTVKDSGR